MWPDSGYPQRKWNDDPDVDRFARIARGICEAYSQALPGMALVARASVMRLNADPDASRRPRPALDASPEDMVEVRSHFSGGQEYGWIAVPVGFATLPSGHQHELGLLIVHQGVMKLAQERGWDPVVLASALNHVKAANFRFRSEGPWKSAPDRRHRARAVARISDDGFGIVQLEVVTSGGEPIACSEDIPSPFHGDDLVRMCKTVRWDGSARVTMDTRGTERQETVFDLSGE